MSFEAADEALLFVLVRGHSGGATLAIIRTSVSEPHDLCGIRAEVGGAGTRERRGSMGPRHAGPRERERVRERETSVLCHGCWGTPPFALHFSVSVLPRLPHPLFRMSLLYCRGCVYSFFVTDTSLNSCLCAMY